jgi:predicted nucleic acid-binding protein
VIASPFVVVYDANVLFPAPLRDTLVRVAMKGLVQAKWTDEIHEEWISNVLEAQPHREEAKLRRAARLMNAAVRDCLVTGYEELIPVLNLPDPDDRHVLAAAIKAGAQTIVTEDKKHFPKSELEKWNIETERADAFLLGLTEINLPLVLELLREQHADLKRNPPTKEEFLDTLLRQGLTQTVATVKPYF